MEDLVKDLRLSLRLLAKKPTVSALAIISLALGIGVNSSIFSLVNAVLLRDLPMRAPEEVVEVYSSDSGGYAYAPSSYPDFLDLRGEEGLFSELAAHNLAIVTWEQDGENELLFGEEVSGNFFDLLGLPPYLGRAFTAAEDLDPLPVVMLGHGFWQRRFGGDPSVLGRPLELNGVDFTVIGVGPEAYKGAFPGLVADYWIPMAMHDVMAEKPSLDNRGSRSIFLKGRLLPGLDIAATEAKLAVLSERYGSAYPETNDGRKFTLVASDDVALHPFLDNALLGVAGVLMAIVGLVLLIACSNIANLLLARAADRQREIAIRMALGSSRGRLIRQLLSESLMLATLGGAMALLFAYWTTRLIVSFQPPLPVPLSLDVGLDFRVLGFTLGLSLLTGVICGLAPALQASRPDLVSAIKHKAGSVNTYRRFGLRNILVVAQVATSTLLLVGAGLFVRSLAQAQSIDPGFNLRRGAAVTVALGFGSRFDEEKGRVFYDQLLERARSQPGVKSAAYVQFLPLSLSMQSRRVQFEGQEHVAEDDWPDVDTVSVGPGYFDTLGIELKNGRDFQVTDAAEAAPVVILNDVAARRYFAGENPLGKRVRFDSEEPWMEVIGIAATGKYRTLGEDPIPFLYTSHRQEYSSMMTLVVASDGDEHALLRQLGEQIDEVSAGVPIFDQKPMSEHLSVMLFPARMGATLLMAFGVLGLVLASVGLYAVVATTVARRTHEVGIRMAIGAGGADVLRLMIKEGMVLVAVGLTFGLAVAAVGSRVLSSLLYGISPSDPLTFVGVAAVLMLVALTANLLPAWRATRIDPIVALRHD